MAAFSDKVVLITGASEGIGRALCLALAPQRPRLVLTARNTERLDSAAAECRAIGADTFVLPADVLIEADCRRIVDKTVAHYGRIDVLVNNAGGTMWSRFDEVTDLTIFKYLMDLNYLSAVHCTYFALPHLKQSKGLLVGISSLAGLNGVPTRTGYAASKHAMFGFFDSLRIELAGSGVDVTMIAPDFVVTEIHRRALKGDGVPLQKTPLNEKNIMSARTCAEVIVHGMERRKRLVILTPRGHVGRWLKLIAPRIIDNIARKAIAEGQ